VRGMNEPAASYDLRKGRLDALLTIGVSETALRSMEEMLSGERQFNGAPLPQPSRWAAVRTSVASGHPASDSLIAAERRRDTSPEGDREAFITGAARADAVVKADYFERYATPGLNEEWVTASLSTF